MSLRVSIFTVKSTPQFSEKLLRSLSQQLYILE